MAISNIAKTITYPFVAKLLFRVHTLCSHRNHGIKSLFMYDLSHTHTLISEPGAFLELILSTRLQNPKTLWRVVKSSMGMDMRMVRLLKLTQCSQKSEFLVQQFAVFLASQLLWYWAENLTVAVTFFAFPKNVSGDWSRALNLCSYL